MWSHFQLFGDWPLATRGTPARERHDAEGGHPWVKVAGKNVWWNPERGEWENVEVQDVPRAPQASASSTDQPVEAIAALGTVHVLNITKSVGPPPGLEVTVIPVGDIVGRLDSYDKKFNPIDVQPFKKCCGTNGRIQLHLATKPVFQDVAKRVKGHVNDYLTFLRTGGDPYVLRLTSCGCTPVSHIF